MDEKDPMDLSGDGGTDDINIDENLQASVEPPSQRPPGGESAPKQVRYYQGEESSEGSGSEVDSYPLSKEQEAAYSYMKELYNRETKADAVNKAMKNLESRLGNAGKRCIEAYHQWGNNFWRNGRGGDILMGLLNAYWHQTMISVGIRLRAMRKKIAKGTTYVLLSPILKEMEDAVRKNSKAFPVPPMMNEDYLIKDLRIETGHYVSISRRIMDDMQPGNDEFDDKKNRLAWKDMVDQAMLSWGGEGSLNRKNPRAPEKIIKLFGTLMKEPSLVNWNNMIGASILWKTNDEFIQNNGEYFQPENGEWRPEFQGIGNFLGLEVPKMYDQFIQRKVNPVEDVKTWYFLGYPGLVRELMENDSLNWAAINALASKNQGDPKLLDNQKLFVQNARDIIKNTPNVNVEPATKLNQMDVKKQKKSAKKISKKEKRDNERDFGKATPKQALLGKEVDDITSYVNAQIPVILTSKSTDEAINRINDAIQKIQSTAETKKIAEAYNIMETTLKILKQGDLDGATATIHLLARLQSPEKKGASVSRYPHNEKGNRKRQDYSDEQEGCNIM